MLQYFSLLRHQFFSSPSFVSQSMVVCPLRDFLEMSGDVSKTCIRHSPAKTSKPVCGFKGAPTDSRGSTRYILRFAQRQHCLQISRLCGAIINNVCIVALQNLTLTNSYKILKFFFSQELPLMHKMMFKFNLST